jgi:hypothetical protein
MLSTDNIVCMPKRISKKLKDSNQIATAVVVLSTSDEPTTDAATLSRVMAEMGRKGGKIGGKRSLRTMSALERKQRAKKAANARWNNKNTNI